MRPTIFARMVIGYLAVFVPIAALSVYAFSELARFRSATDDILRLDSRMRDLCGGLADSLLTQMRYEKKYVITGDKEFLDRFGLIEKDVTARISQGIALADTAGKRGALARIKGSYEGYTASVHEEGTHPKKDQARYGKKREKAVDAILGEIRGLALLTEEETRQRLKDLEESGAGMNRIAMAAGGVFVLLGIVISLMITRSVTRPLKRMREKTRQVAGGTFGPPLTLSSPPEMGELAEDFNLMCVRLNEADRMKADFYSLMAHELRMPLASIREGTSLLLAGVGDAHPEKRKEILAIMAEESTHLIDLINSLLDLAKMEAGMMTFDLKPLAMEPLIGKAVSVLTPLAMARDVALDVRVAEDVPVIAMDAERIGQVLRNLIGNAVKFTPAGGRVIVSAESASGGIRVSVRDTGPGIAEKDLAAIFDKFQQAAVTEYNKIKGTGMGLAIVKHIVNAHGGKVWAESEPGHGSTFIFLLPA